MLVKCNIEHTANALFNHQTKNNSRTEHQKILLKRAKTSFGIHVIRSYLKTHTF